MDAARGPVDDEEQERRETRSTTSVCWWSKFDGNGRGIHNINPDLMQMRTYLLIQYRASTDV